MPRYLLIGAGFSRNWGGWLAAEMFEALLGDPAVIASPELAQLLWTHRAAGGFEAALEELQRLHQADPTRHAGSLRTLEEAIQRTFDMMNSMFAHRSLEFAYSIVDRTPVAIFLRCFDAIFSLNQDLLLEHTYRGSRGDDVIDRNDLRTERDWCLPGLRLDGTSSDTLPYPSATGTWVPTDERTWPAGEQPVFKLHGSVNWRTEAARTVMILGGGKATAIARFPILQWYADVFRSSLERADARLMIIGYGFRDPHINEALSCAFDRGLKAFVISPDGADAAAVTNRLRPTDAGYSLTDFERSLRRAMIGASRRPLSETFGGDAVECTKISRFFDGGD